MGEAARQSAEPAATAAARTRGLTHASRTHGPQTHASQEWVEDAGVELDPGTREALEPGFNFDFGRLRIHTDGRAAESARRLGALAYTAGEHIVFGLGQYAPGTPRGHALIAHELAHVVQQAATPPGYRGGTEGGTAGESYADSADESYADSAVEAVLAGRQAPPAPPAAGPIAMATEPPRQVSFQERMKRIESLLSYGVFDWAITDAEATEAFRILRAMSKSERAQAVRAMRVDRLLDNLPAPFQPALAAILAEAGSAGLIQTQIEQILTYGFFDLIGSISREEAQRAMGLLHALPPAQRDVVIGRIPRGKRRRLYDALDDAGQARFMKMWDERGQRELDRQQAELRPIVPGDRFLLKVSLAGQQVEAFAPRGTPFEVDSGGYGYYAPFDTWIKVMGLRRAEAQQEITSELSRVSGEKITAELAVRPPGTAEEEFAPPPPARQKPQAAEVKTSPPKAAEPDPYTEKENEFLLIYRSEAGRVNALGEQARKDPKRWPEWERESEALRRFWDWHERNRGKPVILKTNLASLLGQLKAEATGRQITKDVERKVREDKEGAAVSPAAIKARLDKNDEFLRLALLLRGESAMRLPYRIPVDSQGVDLLVTGDPARQGVLDNLADELMLFARDHMLDDNFAAIDPKGVLVHLLDQGYFDLLKEAGKQPLTAEVIDRHELIPSSFAESFGKTVAVALTVAAVVGVAVGLGIISGGAALVLLAGVALYAGVSSYLDRRKEIEEKGYDVPVPVTAVQAAGDAVGVSQLIEGLTGERLGTGERLSSVKRSEQAGVGTGSVAVLLTGSRAFRLGQGVGQGVRVRLPGSVPQTLEGVPLKDLDSQFPRTAPAELPPRNPNPGPREAAARDALPDHLRIGFDIWVRGMRNNPKKAVDVEKILERMTPEEIQRICKRPADAYAARKAEAERVAEAKSRSANGDPLRPRLKHNEWKDGVSVSYEKNPPSASELQHAKDIQARTKQPVRLFGDSPSQQSYRGIDGTIGEPPRALQLKELTGNDPSYLKVDAHDAFVRADKAGYSNVEVHLKIPGRTVAECKAAWNGKPGAPRGTEVGWETKLRLQWSKMPMSRVVIEASDGVWVVDPPPASPNLPTVPVNTPPDPDSRRK